MQFIRVALCLIVWALAVAACHDGVPNPNRNLTMAAFAPMRHADYIISPHRVQAQIASLIHADGDTLMADYFTRGYYAQGGRMLWIDRSGVDHRADTLLTYLAAVDSLGFSPQKFRVGLMREDLRRLRQLDFDTLHTISKTIGRLEYYLTKYYLRYALGQRFGFVNPRFLFNRVDLVDTARVSAGYRTLFAVGMDTPSAAFCRGAIAKVAHDSVAEFLRAIQPTDQLYRQYRAMLHDPALMARYRTQILVNMERSRWRTHRSPSDYRKYVVVNIPSFTLTAIDGDQRMQMRVGCGSLAAKTPLLYSDIKRMDINPQWIMPKSIVRQSVARHAGDSGYFAHHNYIIRDRKSGKTLNPRLVSADMLLSPSVSVIQRGGEGNSLGRIIFRFDNAFSVYLHDTPSRSFFARDNRAVSHGCVRVERPYDLAVFLLEDKSDRLKAKIQYSMTARLSADREADQHPDTLQRRLLIGSQRVDPTVPLFITYYTLYPRSGGGVCSYPDVYGYDNLIIKYLSNYR